MTRLICPALHVFEENEAGTLLERDSSEAWGVRTTTTRNLQTCPECGSAELQECSAEEEEDALAFILERIAKERQERDRKELIEIGVSPWRRSA